MSDHTTIVIAYRLSTVRNADTIVALNEGREVELGSQDKMLAKGRLYAQLATHQIAGTTS